MLASALAGLCLAGPAGAGALAGAPLKIGTPGSSGAPSVAVDSSGAALIAWASTPVGKSNHVHYCVLASGASGCVHTGTLAPSHHSFETVIDAVQVLVDGPTMFILADVYGVSDTADEPEQEWDSTDGGATFAQVDAGGSVASGIISADTQPLNAVIVPGANALGFGWDTAGGEPPTFDEFPLSSPPLCSLASCPTAEHYATLEPASNADQVSNAGGMFASQSGPQPGVLALFTTGFRSGPLACSGTAGTAYAYGLQSATNSYDVSPGVAASAWKVSVSQADCGVSSATVAGGPSGFGVLETVNRTSHTVYHRFDQATLGFQTTPKVTVAARREADPSLSQDGAGGVYATFLLGGPGGPISLAYSFDGGTSWMGPATLDADADKSAANLTSAVNPAGQGWAVWTDGGSVFAQSFQAVDARAGSATKAAGTLRIPTQTDYVTSGGNLSVVVDCRGGPCSGSLTLTASASGTTIGKLSFSSLAPGTDTLALVLTSRGLSKLTAGGGSLATTVTASTGAGGSVELHSS